MTEVRIITIGRPRKRNAVDSKTAERLHQEFAAFEADEDAKVAVLYGDDLAFSSGADLNRLPDPRNDGALGPSRRIIGKPVIAAIEGWCVAGGMELAAMCDLRVAGDTARFGFFDRAQGVPLVDGGTVRLPQIIGLGRALDLMLTGREFDAAEALDLGFVNQVVPAGDALDTAVALGQQIAAHPQACMLSDRASVYAALDLGTTAGLRLEQQLGDDTIFTADFIRRAARRSARGALKRLKRSLPI